MSSTRDKIHYAFVYVDYKSRNASLSINFGTPEGLAPGKFGISVAADVILEIPAHTSLWDQMPHASARSRHPCLAVPTP